MSVAHVAVARYDLILSGTADCIFNPDAECDGAGDAWSGRVRVAEPAGRPQAEPSARRSPSRLVPPWDGQERLNILLIGADEQGGGYNTDTMITVSIDPQTNQVVMFQLPRDTVDVPDPAGPGAAPLRRRLPGQDQQLVLGGRRPRRLSPRAHAQHARLQRPQGHPRQPVRPRHQVLRRGQLRGLQGGRRRPRRRDDQRPDPRPRRQLPERRRPTGCASTSRPASST